MMERDIKLLVVDDDAAVRESLAAWLEDSGFHVDEAANGFEAREYCQRHLPDLILCDLQMPRMNGLQLLEEFAATYPELPFVIVSGQGEMSDVIQALKLGAWDYVTKPIKDLEVLEHAMHCALDRARLLQENREYQAHLEQANQKLLAALECMSADEAAGRELQFQLLPENGQQIGPVQCFYQLTPSAALSGDFVDYFAVDQRHVGFYLADVAGHGIPSALVTVMLKNTMSRFLQDCWQGRDMLLLDPSATLARLNSQFFTGGLHKHVTMFYGLIDTEQCNLSYAAAGHYPAAVLIEDGKPRFEGYKSPPLGLFSDRDYPTRQCELKDDASILLASDGIFETMPQTRLAEKERGLLEAVASVGLELAPLAEKLGVSPVARTPPDDVTFLLIKR